MVHYLRKNNKSLIETEAFAKNDFSSAMYLDNYSEYLLSLSVPEQKQLAATIGHIYELRREWWENGGMKSMTLDAFLKHHYTEAAKTLGLEYVVD